MQDSNRPASGSARGTRLTKNNLKLWWPAVGLWLVVCLGLVRPVAAQTPTGSIVGKILDPQGLPVEDANVTLTNEQTNYSYKSKTGSAGGYQFLSIDYGVYEVTAEAKGFRTAVVRDIHLDAASAYTVAPIKLEVGGAAESVTVVAGAEPVNTTSASVSSTVEKKQIDALPILDRNPLNLLELEAGVNIDPNGVTNGNLEVIGGQRTSFSNMTLDGINIQDNFIRENAVGFTPNYPFTSQTQEFTVINQNSDVDQGGGASQISIVTPKGSNAYHGEGFWEYRSNSIGTANDWFNNASGVGVPKLLLNQGGGNVGGPIVKDKLFFYAYYELYRLRSQVPNNTTVLSPTILADLESSNPTVPFTYQPVNAATGAPQGAAERLTCSRS